MYIKLLILVLTFNFCCFSFEAKVKDDMILISKGSYTPLFKSSDNSEDFITVQDFYIDKYPVTNSDFNYFIENNDNWNFNNIKTIFADTNYLNHWKNNNDFKYIADVPVVNVSWFAAEAYCNYLNKRLPTLNEWEYIASVGVKNKNGKEDVDYLKKTLDWYTKNQSDILFTKDTMEINYLGVSGISGVIWEWVYDFNSVILINTDAEGGGLEEILYCGAAATNAIDPSDYVSFMRFAFRSSLEANYTITTLGFRCAKNV